MSSVDPLIVTFVPIMAGTTLIYHTLKNFKKSRKIQDTARIDIASAPMGLVEVQGYAWPFESMIKDSSGRSCILLHYEVQKLVKSKNSSSWRTIREFNHVVSFLVVDESGVCVVSPDSSANAHREMDIQTSHIPLSGIPHDHEQVMQMARGKMPSIFGLKLSSGYRLLEKKILVGSPIYIQGSMSPANSKRINVSGDFKKYLMLIKTLKSNIVHRMKALDIDGSGVITNEEEYGGLNKAAAQLLSTNVQTVEVAGIIANSPSHPLVIADCHEHILLQRLTSFVWTKLIGGTCLIAIGLYFVKTNFFAT